MEMSSRNLVYLCNTRLRRPNIQFLVNQILLGCSDLAAAQDRITKMPPDRSMATFFVFSRFLELVVQTDANGMKLHFAAIISRGSPVDVI